MTAAVPSGQPEEKRARVIAQKDAEDQLDKVEDQEDELEQQQMDLEKKGKESGDVLPDLEVGRSVTGKISVT